jgi:gamma-D-glutamyl-L-lysine dipeptidyl-peptidase
MASLIARTAIAPVLAQASVRAEQSTQLVLGETAAVTDRDGDWLRVCTHLDDYDGWIHKGYVAEVEDAEMAAWRSQAVGWSEGAVIRVGGSPVPVPLRGRVAVDQEGILLPDGRRGRLQSGSVRPWNDAVSVAKAKAPERWAAEHFLGAPYQWGGVTPWGVDCSGLVQTTFAVRGIPLPRNSAQQVTRGQAIPFEGIRPGDLLFFRGETATAITHVAFAGEADTLVHATLACGGMVVESWLPGSRAAALRERLVAVRRLEDR